MTTATMKTDSQIKADVLAELKWAPNVAETDVGVVVHEGIVTLTGNVDSYAKRLAARYAAHCVSGVLDVADDVTVRLSPTFQLTDEDLAKAVRSALKWDALVPDHRIFSTITNGIVTLQGHVDTWAQRLDAEQVVERLSGVRSVVNQIAVTAPLVNPIDVKRQIEDALDRQAHREAKRIGVAVCDGVVTLTGTVRTFAENRAIQGTAGHAPGVRRVENKVVIDPAP